MALLVKAWKSGRWLMAIVGIMILMPLGLSMLFPALRRVAVVQTTSHIRQIGNPAYNPKPAGQKVSIGVDGQGPLLLERGWVLQADRKFQADVYPSPQAAAGALAGQLLEQLDAVVPEGVTVKQVKVCGNSDPAVLSELASTVRAQLGWAKITVQPTGAASKPADHTDQQMIVVQIDHSSSGRHETNTESSETKTMLRVSLTGAAGQMQRDTMVLDKPWVENLDQFESSRQPRRNFVVGYSRQLCSSPAQAGRDAIKDAVARLETHIRRQLGSGITGRWPGFAGDDTEWLQDRIETELRTGQFIVDRFSQKFQRPYGQVWRQAVLVDASPENIAKLANGCMAMLTASRASIFQTALSIFGLMVLICLVYLFLNAATRGYYVWSLRVAGMAILVIGVVLAVRLF